MYLLTANASVQALSSQQDFSNLLKYAASGLEVDTCFVSRVSLVANTGYLLSVPFTKLQLLTVKADVPIDLSLTQVAGVDVYSGFPTEFHLLVTPTGRLITQIKLLSTAAAQVEVAVAGLFS